MGGLLNEELIGKSCLIIAFCYLGGEIENFIVLLF